MSKKVMIILTTLLATLLATSLMGGAYLVYAQEVDENQVAAENLLSLLTESEAEVTSLFETILGDGGEVPEDAAEELTEAQELHAEAQGLYDEARYEECVEKATEALNKYGKALSKATPEPEDPEEPETLTTQEELDEETENMIGVTTAIEKARKRITKLMEIAEELEGQGIDVSEANKLLDDAEQILGSISLEDAEGAEELLSEANGLIGEATGLLKSNGEPIKEEKIEHFRNQAKHHVEQLNSKMNRFMEKFGSSEKHSLMMQAQYGEIIAGLEGIDTKDGLKAAVTQLKLLEKETRNVGKGSEVEEFLGGDTMESFNKQMKLESKLEFYWGIVNGMEEDDPVRTEVGELLVQVEDLLSGAETALVEGDEELVDEMVEEAEEILDNVDDLLDDYVKGHKPDKLSKEDKSNGKGHYKDDEPTEETMEGQEEPEDPEDPEEPEDPGTNTT